MPRQSFQPQADKKGIRWETGPDSFRLRVFGSLRVCVREGDAEVLEGRGRHG